METLEDIDTFISCDKSLLISPAGYGKTYSIVQCIKRTNGKSLILTHTHAGVAAIKKSLNEQCIDKQSYQVETITSYAQKYVKAYCKDEFPNITHSDDYWKFILGKAETIFKNKHIQDVIRSTYQHLFVDEYQDCTVSQHKVIMAISESLPTHILGDPLQGIIDFNKNDRLIDFYNDDLNDFIRVKSLEIPYRWQKEENNRCLGSYLIEVRRKLLGNIENNEQNNIDLNENPQKAFCFIQTNGSAYNYAEINKSTNWKKNANENYTYKEILQQILMNRNNKQELESLLIISKTPFNSNKKPVEIRAELKSRLYCSQLHLLEAIDEPSFYELALCADNVIKDKLINNLKAIQEFLNKIFSKSEIHKWINDSYNLVKKTKDSDKILYTKLKESIEKFKSYPNGINLNHIMEIFHNDIKLKCHRTEFYYSIQSVLITTEENKTVYDTMIAQRNRYRRAGRKVEGKCIGTVALTKGLEFDTVIILDAHNFKNSKDLYVAMTRACKKLIIFSQNPILQPYKKTESKKQN